MTPLFDVDETLHEQFEREKDIEVVTEANQSGTTAILKGIYPKVSKNVQQYKTAYIKNIGNFINARHKDLYDNAPYTRMYWTANDTQAFYNVLKLNQKDISNEIAKTYYASIAAFNPRCAKDPFTVAQLCCVRYFEQKGMKKELELACIYLAFSGSFYPSIHYGSFPLAQPQDYRHIMEYVVNNELSQKYDIKREGSVIGAIKSITNTWLTSYKKQFKSFSDEDAVYLLQQLHNRIKSFMKNIAEVYYKVYDDKDKYLNYNSDMYNEDEFRIADNDSLKAEKYTMTAMNYITTKGVNYKYIKLASDTEVRADELKSIIESIQMDKTNIPLIKEFISLTIIEFMATTNIKEVTGVDYLSHTIVAKPNTKNKNVLRQKEIIEGFLDENSPQYRKRKNRPATKSSYMRSVTAYYAIIVSESNK